MPSAPAGPERAPDLAMCPVPGHSVRTRETLQPVDTEQPADEIRHDLAALEGAAEESAERLARRIAPFVVAAVVLVALAWLAGRRARNRSDSVARRRV